MNLANPTLTTSTDLAEACASTRAQPYRHIHKALRVLFGHVLRRAGALDSADTQERAELVDEVERLLATCADHLAHENRFFHAPLRERAARSVRAFDDEHHEHLATIEALQLLLGRVRDGGDEAPARAYELYLRLSVFVADSLSHMAEEESTLTQALWHHFSDDEIAGMTAALQATLSPQESAYYLRWMARGLNGAELAALFAEARAQAPAQVFDGLLDIARQELDTPRWARVARALGVPPAPGLVAC